jgi:hypothetical protein
MIKKKNPRGKTCSKAHRALYCSEDVEIPGDLRVIPYRRDADVVEFYPTEVIFSYKCIDRMPLLEIAEDADEDEDEFEDEYCKEADEGEDEGAHAEDEDADAEDQEGAEGESGDRDYEAEEILDCIVHSDDSVEYLVKFKNYGKAEWIAAENTVGCKKPIRQYEAVQALKELGTGLIASRKMKVTELCAAVELNAKNEINGLNIRMSYPQF